MSAAATDHMPRSRAPSGSNQPTMVRFHPHERQRLEALAKLHHITLAALVRQLTLESLPDVDALHV